MPWTMQINYVDVRNASSVYTDFFCFRKFHSFNIDSTISYVLFITWPGELFVRIRTKLMFVYMLFDQIDMDI